MRTLLAYLLLTSMIGTAVEWGDRAEGELLWGETLQMGEYSLEAADFTPEDVTPRMVMVKLRKGDELIATRALKSGDSFSLDDEVMVLAEEVRMKDYLLDESAEPRAKVVLLVRAVPELRVRVVSEEDSYEAGDRAKLEIEIENVGMAEAEDVVVELTSDPPIVSSKHSRSNLAPGEVWDDDPDTKDVDLIEVRFKAPATPGPEEVLVKAHARYLDADGGFHEAWGGTSFDLFGPLKVYKHAEDAIKFGEKSFVHLSLSNGGDRTLEVDLSDSAGRDFQADSALKWMMTIPPGGSETASYTISAKKPGDGQILPPADAAYILDGKTYKVTSASPVIDVIGPMVEVEKTATPTRVKTGEEVTVTLMAKNVGNRRTKASVKETVPAWASLTSGETELSRLLLPGEAAALEYTISCQEAGRFEIPPTSVCYRDDDGTACTLESSRLRITVEDPGTEDPAAAEIGEAGSGLQSSASRENGADLSGAEGKNSQNEGSEDGLDGGKFPEDRSILWALPALILIIFVAFERYL
ncbi:MAG TPA: hypothetical protein PLM24_01215 [Methanothrix sp.]|nr:hypothetical protein [Methanothrix sp.]HPJ83135.1 hypothetical protein [Methanothrix sp.]HPR65736.1 hypothetical protein [Methanothrix sp.]